jgi:hypothetical protein
LFGGSASSSKGAPPSGLAGGAGGSTPSGQSRASGSASGTARASGGPGGTAGGGAPSGAGDASVSAKLVSALRSDAGSYRWAAATSGAQSAASLELASGQAVMGIGGFSGEGGRLSLAAFEQYVDRGEIHYYVAGQGAGGGAGGGPGGRGSSSAIANWVKANFKAVSIGGSTVYDLTARK